MNNSLIEASPALNAFGALMTLMPVAGFLTSLVRRKLQIVKNLLSECAECVVLIPEISKAIHHDFRLGESKETGVLLKRLVLFARHGDCHPDDVVVVHSSACDLVLELCQCFRGMCHGVNLIESVYR